MAIALPTGIVTFLFTDIEGSTKLVQTLGSNWHAVGERHHAILRHTIAHAGGLALSTEGDSFFAVFVTPSDAVVAAVEAQRALAVEDWPAGAAVRVRMGIHTGRGLRGGDGYVGLDVHRAARIAGAAHGGQVLLSAVTRTLVEDELPEGMALRDLGSHQLKDIERAEQLHQLVIHGLPSDFPPVRAAGRMMRGLPISRSPLVGRDDEIRAASETLRRARLLTLTGSGGVGKTRLALELASRLSPRPADGDRLVDLAVLSAGSDVAAETARILGIHSAGLTAATEVLCTYLAPATCSWSSTTASTSLHRAARSSVRCSPGVRTSVSWRRVASLSESTVRRSGGWRRSHPRTPVACLSSAHCSAVQTSPLAAMTRRRSNSFAPDSIICPWGSSWSRRGSP